MRCLILEDEEGVKEDEEVLVDKFGITSEVM